MFYKVFVVGLVIFVQLYIIDYIFNKIPLQENDNNYEFKKTILDISELIFMVTIASFVLYKTINDLEKNEKIFSMILVNLIIILTWSVRNLEWARELLGDIDLQYLSNIKFSNNNNNNNNQVIDESDDVIFSKYIKKPSEMLNYSFSKFYNRHNNNIPFKSDNSDNSNDSNDLKKDYSMYNGYPRDHICYGCGCLKRDNGYRFCGKELPGMGTIGCSDRWECRNCKNCDSGNNKNFNKKYGCDKCKCHQTKSGVICGTRSSMTGYIQKCSSDCAECDVCYGSINNKDGKLGYKTVNPSSNLKNVIVNINKVDVDNLFD